ncbi:hypothetical protein ASD67_17675 [Sphingopyxis sp. Root1497]|uniref:GIY-YIG nuclease family protein n=1 Tax=Sphingopyxis sp. Root1497 TaxID=1736474 RepID=UPI0006FA7888|nr:GIY-YIG nuclease family protein [Sphingopyxis sp. Root1497]KQZ61105.1 hypothetical protein ASD67_17675 [Sphingopyxis sp. Root1497]
MLAVIRMLHDADRAAKPDEVYAWIDAEGLRSTRPPPAGKDAEMHYRRDVRFARQELADASILLPSPGLWELADPGDALSLTEAKAVEVIRENRRRRDARRKERKEGRGVSDGGTGVTAAFAISGPSHGPPPVPGTFSLVRGDGPAFTYAFRFGRTSVWKIGYTSDLAARLAEVNRHLPVETDCATWTVARSHSWPGRHPAFAMEQDIFERLASSRTHFERVRCSARALDAAWEAACGAVEEGRARYCQPISASVPP